MKSKYNLKTELLKLCSIHNIKCALIKYKDNGGDYLGHEKTFTLSVYHDDVDMEVLLKEIDFDKYTTESFIKISIDTVVWLHDGSWIEWSDMMDEMGFEAWVYYSTPEIPEYLKEIKQNEYR